MNLWAMASIGYVTYIAGFFVPSCESVVWFSLSPDRSPALKIVSSLDDWWMKIEKTTEMIIEMMMMMMMMVIVSDYDEWHIFFMEICAHLWQFSYGWWWRPPSSKVCEVSVGTPAGAYVAIGWGYEPLADSQVGANHQVDSMVYYRYIYIPSGKLT